MTRRELACCHPEARWIWPRSPVGSVEKSQALFQESFRLDEVGVVRTPSDVAVIGQGRRIIEKASRATEAADTPKAEVLDLQLEQAKGRLGLSGSELVAAVGHEDDRGRGVRAQDYLSMVGDKPGITPWRRCWGQRLVDVGDGLISPPQSVAGVGSQPEAAKHVENFVIGEMRPDTRADANEVVFSRIELGAKDVVGGLADLDPVALPTVAAEHGLERRGHLLRVACERGIEDEGPLGQTVPFSPSAGYC